MKLKDIKEVSLSIGVLDDLAFPGLTLARLKKKIKEYGDEEMGIIINRVAFVSVVPVIPIMSIFEYEFALSKMVAAQGCKYQSLTCPKFEDLTTGCRFDSRQFNRPYLLFNVKLSYGSFQTKRQGDRHFQKLPERPLNLAEALAVYTQVPISGHIVIPDTSCQKHWLSISKSPETGIKIEPYLDGPKSLKNVIFLTGEKRWQP
jgi:hypothetical protein